mmetsp:Transcript_54314/g.109028  ORF Transcript_54314/g.109028 Transcript_54314/m.109028 type:complete len:369 (-) Transcript_54314:316-1422(-)
MHLNIASGGRAQLRAHVGGAGRVLRGTVDALSEDLEEACQHPRRKVRSPEGPHKGRPCRASSEELSDDQVSAGGGAEVEHVGLADVDDVERRDDGLGDVASSEEQPLAHGPWDEAVLVSVSLLEAEAQLLEVAVRDYHRQKQHRQRVAERLVPQVPCDVGVRPPIDPAERRQALQPRVIQCLGRGGAVSSWPQEALHEVPAHGAALVPAVVLGSSHAAGETPTGVLPSGALAWCLADKKSMCDGADAPEVRRTISEWLGALQHLGHNVRRWILLGDRVVGVENCSQPEVPNLHYGIRHLGGEHQGAGAQVAMVDLRSVAVGKRQHRLAHVGRARLLLQPVALVQALQPVLDVTAWPMVGDDVEVVAVL